jgi:hypothetical protein
MILPFSATVEDGRMNYSALGPHKTGDPFGHFWFRCPRTRAWLTVIASNGDGWIKDLAGNPWEHVSVSVSNRCPVWDEMCFVKDLFWGPEECVVQFHPPRSQYVNQHPFVLHLWKPLGVSLPLPPKAAL